MVSKPRVKILKVGTICFEPSELASAFTQQIKSEIGIGSGSTVTLVEADRIILVDTGFDYKWLDTTDNNRRNAEDLNRVLKDHGIVPDYIDIVFITHWHRDHYGNTGIFRKATLLASNGTVERFGLDNFRGVGDREEIAKGVRMILTPGHTIDHASIIADSMLGGLNARVAITGDAIISHSYFQSGNIWKYNADFYNTDAAYESISRLTNLSDIIIPGHGGPFMTYHPEWMNIHTDRIDN